MQNSLEIVSEGMLEVICVSRGDSTVKNLACKRKSTEANSGEQFDDKTDQPKSKGNAENRLSPEPSKKKLKQEDSLLKENSRQVYDLENILLSKSNQTKENKNIDLKIYPGPSNERLKEGTLEGKTSSEIWSGMKDLPAMVWGAHNTTMTLEERAKFLAEPPEWTEAVRKVLTFNSASTSSKK